MPRHTVERLFTAGLRVPATDQGAAACMSVVKNSAEVGVTWLHFYVSQVLNRTFCVYDVALLDAMREVAGKNNTPVGAITPVSVLSPYFYCS